MDEEKKEKVRTGVTDITALRKQPSRLSVCLRLVVLAEQVLPVVVAVWSAHYAVNVLARRQVGVLGESR